MSCCRSCCSDHFFRATQEKWCSTISGINFLYWLCLILIRWQQRVGGKPPILHQSVLLALCGCFSLSLCPSSDAVLQWAGPYLIHHLPKTLGATLWSSAHITTWFGCVPAFLQAAYVQFMSYHSLYQPILYVSRSTGLPRQIRKLSLCAWVCMDKIQQRMNAEGFNGEEKYKMNGTWRYRGFTTAQITL